VDARRGRSPGARDRAVRAGARGHGRAEGVLTMATSGPLTATFDPTRAAVALEVDGSQWGTDPEDITHITITRQVAGTPDVPVRGVDNLAVIGGAFVGSDIEAPLHETVTYQLVGV